MSKIQGNNDKLLEYKSKTGEILTQYYFPDDDQKKAALLHQYRILMGISKSVNNPKLCKNCKNEKTLFYSEGCYVCKKCGETELGVIIEHVIKTNRGQYKSINHIKICSNAYRLKNGATYQIKY